MKSYVPAVMGICGAVKCLTFVAQHYAIHFSNEVVVLVTLAMIYGFYRVIKDL